MRFNKKRGVYIFLKQDQSPTVADLLIVLQSVSQFPYQETNLRELLKNLSFRFRKQSEKII
ncbi:hypothetical protein C0J52_06224 [Blattella germanica]|nr:hypothetical protein C0J52_06224 [Blattella germanica]